MVGRVLQNINEKPLGTDAQNVRALLILGILALRLGKISGRSIYEGGINPRLAEV